MADLLARPLSVNFETKYLKRLNHDEILNALRVQVDISHIQAIQLTEKKCIVTLKDDRTKTKLMLERISLQNKHINLLDVDSAITNVTIKDAPFELSDTVILQQMGRFGEVVSGSLARGKIRDTGIENGTRYIKLLNCVPLLPPTINIGRFTVRIFADNNRTACKICGETNQCPNKNTTSEYKPSYSDTVKPKL